MRNHLGKFLFCTLLSVMLLFSCGTDEELKAIEDSYVRAMNSSEDTKLQATSDYLLAVILHQQEIESSNPKKLNIKLLETASQFVKDTAETNEEVRTDKNLTVKAITIRMLSASYYNETGDRVESVLALSEAFDGFDLLMDLYPDDPEVRGYRGINYSALPEIFGKEDIIDSDFMFLHDYVLANENIAPHLAEFLPTVFNKAVKYYSEREETDKAAIFTEILESKF